MAAKRLRILHFDIENRPLAYLGPEYTTAEITAIAACFDGEPKSMRVWLLGRDKPRAMLVGFSKMWAQADIGVGHYIRQHDLPVINGALMEYGLPTLEQKLTIDTKSDLTNRRYLSASQENLCEMLGISATKVHMSNAKWREANRLTPEGIALTAERAMGDVRQNIELRRELVKRGLLGSPKVWRA